MSLKELQKQFSEEIIEGSADKMLSKIKEHESISKEGLFSIYVNNYYLGLREVLQHVFPVTKSIVGEKFFNGTVREFAKSTPPASGNLDDYGESFSEFLSGFEPAEQLPYLPSMAEFEWKYHLCEIADEEEKLLPEELVGLEPEDLLSLKFEFHPSVQFFESAFPILKIWQESHKEEFGDINLDNETGDSLLLIRNNREVIFVPMNKSEIIFIKNLYEGNLLSDALELSIEEDENFDLNHVINKHISSGTWSGINQGK